MADLKCQGDGLGFARSERRTQNARIDRTGQGTLDEPGLGANGAADFVTDRGRHQDRAKERWEEPQLFDLLQPDEGA